VAKQRNRAGNRGHGRGARKRFFLLPWAIAAVALITLVALVTPHSASGHPTPRKDAETVQASKMMPSSSYAGYPRVEGVYREAAMVPEVLDGIYCYCECEQHSGHYSLLDCYKSDHAAGCDVCLSEAQLAYTLSAQGQSLNHIRAAVDRLYKM
jgi:hypothetical protein